MKFFQSLITGYRLTTKIFWLLISISLFVSCSSKDTTGYFENDKYLEENYSKHEYRIEMRDGIKLHTLVFLPNDIAEPHPILLCRSPYGCGPYGADSGYYNYKREAWTHFAREGFIIVYQDVRGRFMSEGEYDNMRPYKADKAGTETDESTDTYDTIDWLVNNIPNNNGKVGLWGISYPGFYAAQGAVEAHPALKAVSPQAPIANWFSRDDWHHNGALAIGGSFYFLYQFGPVREGLVQQWPPEFDFLTNNGYDFFLKLGPLKNVNELYYHNNIPFWNDVLEHDTYDEFWQPRNNLPGLKNIKPATLVVGGWFDAENLYGALNTYQSIEKNSPNSKNNLIMGPWYHGGWVRCAGDSLGDIYFGTKTRDYYVFNVELPFFNYYLKEKGELDLPEASIFITGSNEWKAFDVWPPEGLQELDFYLGKNEKLLEEFFSSDENEFVEYISDPANPVPFTKEITTKIPKLYMDEDQSFVVDREDVILFQTEPLDKDLTVMGKITADLFVSTSGTDCDFVVKVIDVIPAAEMNSSSITRDYLMLLRGDIFRTKFRNSFENPEPMIPNEVTNLKFDLDDVAHTFKKGHRIMVQIQSSWFPLFDRNPQKFMKIGDAEESDFQKATQRVFFADDFRSKIIFNKYN